MNVLILTPDAVGSTLLQRLITIYMQFYPFDRPVINLHELTNGIIKYFSPEFNRELLGKSRDFANQPWGYYQSLQEIVELLASADHFKTSRLAQYHICKRKDPIEHQIPFYQYLDNNFFIISCRRNNVFEHGLAWGLTKIHNRLNFYNHNDKLEFCLNLYRNPVDIDIKGFVGQLDAYAAYIEWCKHFTVSSYFVYEDDLPNIEKYILGLPIFPTKAPALSWQDRFGISFDNWNKCHYYNSDLGTMALSHPETLKQLTTEPHRTGHRRELTVQNQNLLTQSFSTERLEFINRYQSLYQTVNASIKQMVDLGILVTPVPIKRQTLQEKKFMIKNFNHCLDIYNQWIVDHPDIGQPISDNLLLQQTQSENDLWNNHSVDKPLAIAN